MAQQFIRNCRVVFTSDIDTIDVSNLRITFEVTKDISFFANRCELRIYNLSANTRAKIAKEYTQIAIYAGYGDKSSLLFDGDIRNIYHLREATEIVTVCYCADGDRYLRNPSALGFTSSVSVTAGHQVSALMYTLIGNLRVPMGEMNIVAPDGTVIRDSKSSGGSPTLIPSGGFTERGKTEAILNKLADMYRFNWYIANGSFYAVGATQVLERFPIIPVSQTTGMIGSPTITEVGVEVKTLMNPTYSPGARISIFSVGSTIEFANMFFYDVKQTIGGEGASGRSYKVLRVTHTGDTRGNDWYSEVETQANWGSPSTAY